MKAWDHYSYYHSVIRDYLYVLFVKNTALLLILLQYTYLVQGTHQYILNNTVPGYLTTNRKAGPGWIFYLAVMGCAIYTNLSTTTLQCFTPEYFLAVISLLFVLLICLPCVLYELKHQGCPKSCFSTPHVEFIQLRPSRQVGVSDTVSSPQRHTNFNIKPSTDDG